MASAINEVRKVLTSAIRRMYDSKVDLNLGSRVSAGHWLGARRL